MFHFSGIQNNFYWEICNKENFWDLAKSQFSFNSYIYLRNEKLDRLFFWKLTITVQSSMIENTNYHYVKKNNYHKKTLHFTCSIQRIRLHFSSRLQTLLPTNLKVWLRNNLRAREAAANGKGRHTVCCRRFTIVPSVLLLSFRLSPKSEVQGSARNWNSFAFTASARIRHLSSLFQCFLAVFINVISHLMVCPIISTIKSPEILLIFPQAGLLSRRIFVWE